MADIPADQSKDIIKVAAAANNTLLKVSATKLDNALAQAKELEGTAQTLCDFFNYSLPALTLAHDLATTLQNIDVQKSIALYLNKVAKDPNDDISLRRLAARELKFLNSDGIKARVPKVVLLAMQRSSSMQKLV